MTELVLNDLSDKALVERVTSLCMRKSEATAEIVRCLIEVEARQIHLNAAYPSMYVYCLRRLGMSDGATIRALNAARLARRFPPLLPAIARGELHISSLPLLRDHFTVANCDELLAAVVGKSRNEIDAILVSRRPKPDVPTYISPVVEPVLFPGVPPEACTGCPAKRSYSRVSPLSPSRFEMRLTVSLEVYEKIERVKELMRHRNVSGDLALVIERALDALLANLERDRLGKSRRPRVSARGTKQGSISRATRREVFARDGEQCTFRDGGGNRCPARGLLELDHIDARACGGSDDAANLRVLCRAHNHLHAEATFGRKHIADAIDLRRERSRIENVDARDDLAGDVEAIDSRAPASVTFEERAPVAGAQTERAPVAGAQTERAPTALPPSELTLDQPAPPVVVPVAPLPAKVRPVVIPSASALFERARTARPTQSRIQASRGLAGVARGAASSGDDGAGVSAARRAAGDDDRAHVDGKRFPQFRPRSTPLGRLSLVRSTASQRYSAAVEVLRSRIDELERLREQFVSKALSSNRLALRCLARVASRREAS